MAYTRTNPDKTQLARSPSVRGLTLCLLVLALGLLGWRALSMFSAPVPVANAHAFTPLAETLTGPGHVRVESDPNGALLILIDGPEGALSNALVTRLRNLASRLYPDAPPATIEQYPFADGATPRPSSTDLAELAVLLLIAGGLALSLGRSIVRAPNHLPDLTTPAHPPASFHPPSLQSVSEPAHAAPPAQLDTVEKAADLAQEDPEATAAIIRQWLHREEGRA